MALLIHATDVAVHSQLILPSIAIRFDQNRNLLPVVEPLYTQDFLTCASRDYILYTGIPETALPELKRLMKEKAKP